MDSSGVLILKTYEETIGYTAGWSANYIWWLLVGILLFSIGIVLIVNMESDASAGLVFVTGVISIAVFILCICYHTPVKETRHVVLPTEDVGLIEFYDKYDVIKQDGMTYIVREKNKTS